MLPIDEIGIIKEFIVKRRLAKKFADGLFKKAEAECLKLVSVGCMPIDKKYVYIFARYL